MSERSSLYLSALASKNDSGKIPVWFMRQAGRYQPSYQELKKKYSFTELCMTPELACQVTLLPIQEMPLDAAILFSDILFPLQALHLSVSFDENSVPHVVAASRYSNSVQGRIQSVLKNQIKPLKEVCRSVYNAIPLIKKELHQRLLPLIGFSGAPWTLMTYVLAGRTSENGQVALHLLRQDPNLFLQLLHRVEKIVIDHISEQILAGCDVIQLFDSWAASLSHDEYSYYIVPSLQRVIQALPTRKEGSKCPTIYFTKQIEKRVSLLSNSSLTAVCCDTESSLIEVVNWGLQHGIAVQGNLDPMLLLEKKESPLLQETLFSMLSAMKNSPNYICSLGHGIPKNAQYETVRFVAEYLSNW